jgi:hypothetical protein
MKRREVARFAFLILFVSIMSCSKGEPVIIIEDTLPATIAFNEIQSTGNPDWIELYNYGEETVDLEGFMVYDKEASSYTLPAGYKMQPGDFFILYCDDQGVDVNLPFKLTSQGESITLKRPDGKMIDNIVFPAMENGQTYARFPDGNGTWQVTGFATQNQTNGSGPISFFKSYQYTPGIPLVNDDIAFTLDISDATNVSKIQLIYAIDAGANQSIDMTSSDNINYAATIPALTSDGELYYYFVLTDNGGSEVLLPDDALTDPYDITITSGEVPNLVINEIMASNKTNLPDPDGLADEYDDWIEIYNAGTEAVDMGRFYFSDAENPFDDRIPGDAPNKTTIQPGGYLLFWADSDTEQGPNHLKFKLSADGEILSLYYKDGRLIDSHSFGIQSADISEGRSPDGNNNWIKFNTPTPGTSNQ